MELGLRITGGRSAEEVERHFQRLVEGRVLNLSPDLRLMMRPFRESGKSWNKDGIIMDMG